MQTDETSVRFLRITLLVALLSGIAFCLPLWSASRDYPLMPLFQWYPALPSKLDWLWLVMIVGAAVASVRWYRASVAVLLAVVLHLYFADQNRGQPWVYLYWVLLLFTLLPDRSALAACRMALSAMYVWAGIQKLNGHFFGFIPSWFVEPARNWGFPNSLVSGLALLVAASPFVEILLGFGFWVPRLRRGMAGLAVALHVVSLVFLGPIGHNENLVVWPWNIAMAALVLVLFGTGAPPEFRVSLREMWRQKWAATILGLFVFLPVLSFWGRWDSCFSFSLYSENQATAQVYVQDGFRSRIPPAKLPFVHPVPGHDPSFQAPYYFHHLEWGQKILGVPPMSEPRAFEIMFRKFSETAQPGDCHMIVRTRAGRSFLHRPGQLLPELLD